MSVMQSLIDRVLSKDIQTRLIDVRHTIHRTPELGFEEFNTQKLVIEVLTYLGITDIKTVAGTGVIARVPGKNRQHPVIALRGDMDALPIQENSGLPFSSEIPGKMHACGHDIHTTWLLAAGAILMKEPPEGDVLLVFQPAEEIAKGALAILETGALDEVKAIFGGHVDRNFELGDIVIQPGAISASTDTFTITYEGKSAHGARPHEGADPLLAMSALVQSLHIIVSRQINPDHPGVLTVGTFHSGSAHNIIPQSATIKGTIRADREETRATIEDALKIKADMIAAAYQVTPKIEFEKGNPAIINKSPFINWAEKGVKESVGSDRIRQLEYKNMGGEDFAQYLQTIPGAFIRVGVREGNSARIPAHNPAFYVVDQALLVGGVVLAKIAQVASKEICNEGIIYE